MEEVWKHINEENIYQVSNLGRVKSCERFANGLKKKYLRKKLLKIKKKNNRCYVAFYILKSGKQTAAPVDMLVAKSFIPNLLNKKYIEHINKDYTDNRAENLRWVDLNDLKSTKKRICSDCKIEKNIEDFYKWNRDKYCGKKFICKVCDNGRAKKYRDNNKEKEKIRRRKKYLKRRDIEILKDNEYKKKRRAIDPSFKLLRNLRDRHRIAVKSAFAEKKFRTTKLLGCDSKFLKTYFEKLFKPDMNWSNYGKIWNIDHIYPLSKVDWNNKEQVAMVCNYKNLMPQYIWVNSHKRAKLNYYESFNEL